VSEQRRRRRMHAARRAAGGGRAGDAGRLESGISMARPRAVADPSVSDAATLGRACCSEERRLRLTAYGCNSRRECESHGVTAAHGYLQPQRNYQCFAGLLAMNRISDGGKSGVMEEELGNREGVGHQNCHSLDEKEQRKILLHASILRKCGELTAELQLFLSHAGVAPVPNRRRQ
ncbi:hypothetical protein EVAR_99786_1, partial [Eumeta japonica]